MAGITFILITIFMGLQIGNGYVQQVSLSWTQGVGHISINFTESIPDLTEFAELTNGVNPRDVYLCFTGWWSAFREPNFKDLAYSGTDHSWMGDTECYEFERMRPTVSLRRLGPSETSTDTLYMIAEPWYEGEDVLIEKPVYIENKMPTFSVFATGNSSWLLFEGEYLDGQSKCLEKPNGSDDKFFSAFNPLWINTDVGGMQHVGSVFKGCDQQAAAEYRKNVLRM